MRTILAACLVVAGANGAWADPARLESGIVPSGPARAAIKEWFTAGREVTCSDAKAAEGPCDMGRALVFRSFHDVNETNALVFVLYAPSISTAVHLAVAHFGRSGERWSLVRNVRGVLGEGPDSLTFEAGRAAFTMSTPMPGDDRCCLTGKQSYRFDLATGGVISGPKAPAKGNAQPSPATAPARFTGYTYIHNGSSVLVDERVGEIRYDEPKASLMATVRKGDLLFRGSFGKDGVVTGTAYAFKTGCEPAPYAVRGTHDGPAIVLRGNAPRRDPSSCAVVGMTKSSAHAVLRFEEYSDY